jgi:hypothetical protein
MVAFETTAYTVSAIYVGEEALEFIENSEKSGTCARLHTFDDIEEGWREWEMYVDSHN